MEYGSRICEQNVKERMSVTVNEKGGAERRINILKRGPGKLNHIMLNETIIKKAENYHLQCDRFLTNGIPGIIQHNRVLVEIRPRYDIGQVAGPGFDPANSAQEKALNLKARFIPNTIYSTARLCEALAQFVKDFNFAVFIYGANFINVAEIPGNASFYVPEHPIVALGTPFDLRNHIPPNTVIRYVSTGVSSSGNVQLVLSSQFLTNFYIQFDEVFAKQIGFPTLVYAHDDQAGTITMSNQPDVEALIDEDQLLGDTFSLISNVTEGRNISSTRSIFSVEERMSIDIEMSLPVAQTIDVTNGDEHHTFLLSRFAIGDYQKRYNMVQQSNGYVVTKTVLQNTIDSGFIDLVQDAPESHVSQLLSGEIRQLNMRLVLRYKNYFVGVGGHLAHTVERKIIEMDPSGLYDLLLQFNKRV